MTLNILLCSKACFNLIKTLNLQYVGKLIKSVYNETFLEKYSYKQYENAITL